MAERKIGRGTLYIFLGKGAMIGISVISGILVPRLIGPEAMGFYSYWLSIYFILGMVFNFAGPPILNRYLPELRRVDPLSIHPLLKRILAIKLPIILLVLFFGWWFFSAERIHFLIIFFASAAFTLSIVLSDILYAYKKMGLCVLLRLSQMLTRLALVLFLFVFLKEKGLILAILFAPILATFIFAPHTFRLLPKTSGKLKKSFKAYLSFGVWIYLGSLCQTLIIWLAPVLSRRYITDMALIGYLGLGIQICLRTNKLVHAIGEGVFPSLVEFYATKDGRFRTSLETSWKYTNLILFPLLAGALVLIKPAIFLLIGEKFLPSVPIIYLLLPSAFFVSLSVIHRQILLVHEHHKAIFWAQFLGFSTFIVSTIYLIKRIGITGAPISVSLGSLISFAALFLLSIRLEKIRDYFPHFFKPLLASIAMALLLNLIQVNSLSVLLFAILIGVILYIGLMWLIRGIDTSDLERLKGALIKHKVDK